MIDKDKIKLETEKINKRNKRLKYLKLALLISLMFLIVTYTVLSVFYADGAFTINLDNNFSKKTGMVIYEDSKERQPKLILEVKDINFMDNISKDWLPKDIDNQGDGSHNGDNYIAYTFYVENRGSEDISYWYKTSIYNIIKNVDEAVRVMIYRGDQTKVYAKTAKNGEPEKDTIPFYSDSVVELEQRKGLAPGQIDKFTVVVWLEGDDPECIDNIIGGQLKLKMEFNEEFLEND